MVTLMDKAKKRCFNQVWYIFQRQKYRDFGTPQQIRILSLGRVISQPWEAILHYTSTQQERKTMKSGIDLIFGNHPTSFATKF
jgi:hypothetical protein